MVSSAATRLEGYIRASRDAVRAASYRTDMKPAGTTANVRKLKALFASRSASDSCLQQRALKSQGAAKKPSLSKLHALQSLRFRQRRSKSQLSLPVPQRQESTESAADKSCEDSASKQVVFLGESRGRSLSFPIPTCLGMTQDQFFREGCLTSIDAESLAHLTSWAVLVAPEADNFPWKLRTEIDSDYRC